MGTKTNPGKYDCYAKAEPDEPIFTLLARDPVAAVLVCLWGELREGRYEDATDSILDLVHALRHSNPVISQSDIDKAVEAEQCSLAMFEWIRKHRPERMIAAIHKAEAED